MLAFALIASLLAADASHAPAFRPPSAAARTSVSLFGGLLTAGGLAGAGLLSGLIVSIAACGGGGLCGLLYGGYGFIGGAGLGLLALPFVDYGIARAMGGRGTLISGVLGYAAGAVLAAAFIAGAIGIGYDPLIVDRAPPMVTLGVLAGISFIAAPAIALEISNGAQVQLMPTLTPIAGGATAGFALAF